MKVSSLNYQKTLALTLFLILGAKLSTVSAQKVEVIQFDQLNTIITEKDAPIRVINFWATWCAPCIKELPQFEALYEKYKSQNMEVILVSMDFVENLDDKVKKFALKKSLKSKLYLLNETDYNSFIDKIDPTWSGAIPATLIVDSRKNKRIFFEKEFKEGELENSYLNFIK
ncbi:TlpA family protein disulfide reductase [Reichenbachiella agarivorans]|uniref:TlpA family protein disulfide reductase n=1 Tax=Reichenbachiella agarivorans TaxID=2979464 RepID=A0ABY6CTR5_9BACT|nr:TlpA disulfide reductase family protein [Reichenbachiella agarivorans]UXP33906.1 TlpA family protein disulfide reductase [Reichenbachiella agarivorans]